ncbi:hypothetical protein L208DRAFT_1301305, partial [Tricholoma matsutake]
SIPGDKWVDSANLYLGGIISGEPNQKRIGYYLRRLIGDMKKSYTHGVCYSHTACHPEGRNTWSAIAAVVMDFPVGHLTTGLSSITSHIFCMVCECWHQNSLTCTDFECWKLRDDAEMQKHAKEWEDATSEAVRKTLYEAFFFISYV